MSKAIKNINSNTKDNQLFGKVAELIELARKTVASTVNLTMTRTYFEIGKMIVETEQQGEHRAKFGEGVLNDLSLRLTDKFGKGFSERNLRNMRQFFLVYADRTTPIRQTPSGELENDQSLHSSIRLTASIELENVENSIRQTPSAKFHSFTCNYSAS